MLVRLHVHYDDERKSFWADSTDLDGLVVSGGDLNELRAEVNAAAGELLSFAVTSPRARVETELRIRDTSLRSDQPLSS